MPAHWLIKSEPSEYSFARLQADGRTEWTGVRNFEARNNLRAMAMGDLCLYYHSTEAKAVVGIARVSRPARSDPTAPGEDWSSVEVEPVEPLTNPVSLERIRADAALKDFQLVTRGRLSVVPVTPGQYARVLGLSLRPEAPAPATPRKRSSRSRSAMRRKRAR
ncbi:MAG TPA: EVE domain-containing protein [Myxococcaceae bacterium]|nr:EVE domain-containing protein [Myxococcaceae bacterium]